MSYRFTAALAAVALAAGASSALADGGHGHDGRDDGHRHGTAFKAHLFGSQPAGPALFAVKPGGAPWVIRSGDAKVGRDARVTVRVAGLVIPTAPQNGTNPVSNLAATVYCNGAAVATTHAVPFSSAGDARIDETLATPLPSPCLAPAVLLNPAPGGAVNAAVYIGATGV
jgi:hypothetical protein